MSKINEDQSVQKTKITVINNVEHPQLNIIYLKWIQCIKVNNKVNKFK